MESVGLYKWYISRENHVQAKIIKDTRTIGADVGRDLGEDFNEVNKTIVGRMAFELACSLEGLREGYASLMMKLTPEDRKKYVDGFDHEELLKVEAFVTLDNTIPRCLFERGTVMGTGYLLVRGTRDAAEAYLRWLLERGEAQFASDVMISHKILARVNYNWFTVAPEHLEAYNIGEFVFIDMDELG